VNLSWKFLAALFLFNLLATSAVWLRPWPADTDPYFLAWHIKNGSVPVGYPFAFFSLMGVLPWNDVYMRLVPVLLCFAAALATGFIADLLLGGFGEGKLEPLRQGSEVKKGWFSELVSGVLWREPGWAAAFLVYGFPVFGFRFGVFEEDLLGIVLCLGGLFFALSWFLDRGGAEDLALSCVFFLLALMTWRGSVFFLLCVGLLGVLKESKRVLLVFVAVALVAAWFFGVGVSSVPVPSFSGAGENLPGLYMMIPALLIGLLGLWVLKEASLELRLWSVFFLVLGAWVAKFLLWCVFPLAVLMVMLLRAVRVERRLFVLQVFMVSGVLVAAGSLWNAPPSAERMEGVRSAVAVTGSDLVANEWSLGHDVLWFGGNPEFSPLDNWDDIERSNASWVLGNCTRYKEFRLVGNYSLFCLFAR